jgi:hypothetical protein
MVWPHSRAWLGLPRAWRPCGSSGIILVLGVIGVWLAILWAIVLTVPTPRQAALASSFYSIGQTARLRGLPGVRLRIPLDRDTFEDLHQALWDDNRLAFDEVNSRPGWIQVFDGQGVRIIDVYEAGFRVEILDGPNAGVQAWAMLHQLRP